MTALSLIDHLQSAVFRLEASSPHNCAAYHAALQAFGADDDDHPGITHPIVNLNGTAVADLIEQQRAIIRGLDATMALMRQALPHGRDYPHVGNALVEQARAQAEIRLATMESVKAVHVRLAKDLVRQQRERRRR